MSDIKEKLIKIMNETYGQYVLGSSGWKNTSTGTTYTEAERLAELILSNLDNILDKSEWVKLPCKIGDIVYAMLPLGRTGTLFTTGKVVERFIDDIIIKKSTVEIHSNRVNESDIYCNYYGTLGKDVFLTREQAEQRLKEIRDCTDINVGSRKD